MNDPLYLPPLNRDAALELGEKIDALLSSINAHEIRLARSYARLGGYLREVKQQQFWITYGFDRFSTYLEQIRERIGRQRSQVYGYLSVAETLLPLMSEEDLERVGITRAYELRRLVLGGGSLEATLPQTEEEKDQPSVRIMDYAADPKVTAALLHVKVNELLHVHEGPRGPWLELNGFYATADERKEIDQFWALGRQVLQIPAEAEEYEAKKQIFMAAVREFVGTYSGRLSDG